MEVNIKNLKPYIGIHNNDCLQYCVFTIMGLKVMEPTNSFAVKFSALGINLRQKFSIFHSD